ncbi:hypothetical protein IJU97_03305 [bacterium]|nr:hypothetical protein [bacterium]
MITKLPKKIDLQEEVHFRGEILMPKSKLKSLNEEREKKGQTVFSNTRNAAA